MEHIWQLVYDFRQAMDKAKASGAFIRSTFFTEFPQGCCGDTCYLLAEYLLENGINTEYVWGVKGSQSHAWLAVAETKTRIQCRTASIPLTCRMNDSVNSYQALLASINNYEARENDAEMPVHTHDLTGQTIIDITGDQFRYCSELLYYDIPVYVGSMDAMHMLFEIRDIHECQGLKGVGEYNEHRLTSLYENIKQYL